MGNHPFDTALAAFAVVIIANAVIVSEGLYDALMVRAEFIRTGKNGAQKRYVRYRTRLNTLRFLRQVEMLAAVYVGYVNPEHTGAWLLAIFTLGEVITAGIVVGDYATRTQTMMDLEEADKAKGHHP